ncbi:hypothetical protein VF10_21555 [Nostoc linckia z13]|nr:hypothetical protein VF10_21555 [Nostoc linckia z13]
MPQSCAFGVQVAMSAKGRVSPGREQPDGDGKATSPIRRNPQTPTVTSEQACQQSWANPRRLPVLPACARNSQ